MKVLTSCSAVTRITRKRTILHGTRHASQRHCAACWEELPQKCPESTGNAFSAYHFRAFSLFPFAAGFVISRLYKTSQSFYNAFISALCFFFFRALSVLKTRSDHMLITGRCAGDIKQWFFQAFCFCFIFCLPSSFSIISAAEHAIMFC